jgi:hypothetical protein
MIHRRGVLPVLLLLALVLVGTVVQIVRGPSAAAPAATSRPSVIETPVPTETAREVMASLADVQRAYRLGDVRQLCRPGVLVDRAVIRAQNAHGDGCESEVESLLATRPSLKVTVHDVNVVGDLATAAVTTASGDTTVDFVRRGARWLLSFSDGDDPLPALAGTA